MTHVPDFDFYGRAPVRVVCRHLPRGRLQGAQRRPWHAGTLHTLACACRGMSERSKGIGDMYPRHCRVVLSGRRMLCIEELGLEAPRQWGQACGCKAKDAQSDVVIAHTVR